MKKRRKIKVGDVEIGGDAKISVQSMTNTDTSDITATIAQIKRLEKVGCEIIRVSVLDENSAICVGQIKKGVKIPIIADIHFDYKLALLSMKNNADALRINPGNIGAKWKLKEIVNFAKDNNIVIRVGVNAGSLDKKLLSETNLSLAEKMFISAEKSINFFESLNFSNIKVSLKASSVLDTINAYKLFSSKFDFPLHIGITEAGPLNSGLVKSSIGVAMLLNEGLGDTIRISLTADPVFEVKAAYDILRALNIRKKGIEIISCPTCGRCKIDLISLVQELEKKIEGNKKNLKVAVMGCVVNGPGEAKDADIGVAGGRGLGVLFKKGKVIKKIKEENLLEALLAEIEKEGR